MTKEFTPQELLQYNGLIKPEIYIACKNTVFDVSQSEFYKPDGGYGLFAGHDCSVNLAKMKFDQEYLDKYGKILLDDKETQTLQEWYDKFVGKYPVVGILKKTE